MEDFGVSFRLSTRKIKAPSVYDMFDYNKKSIKNNRGFRTMTWDDHLPR